MKNRNQKLADYLSGIPAGLRNRVQFDIPKETIDRWQSGLHAKDDDEEQSISVYDPIGEGFFGEGVTVKRVDAALRRIGAKNPVVVNVNSPGGDVFEGLAIYNRLREHQGEVTVKVLGLAASAASVIAMAGDTVQIAKSGFLMVHNVWGVVIGNKNDLREAADMIEPFDDALAQIYADRSGVDLKAIKKLMDAETWLNGSQAIEDGFADELLPADQVEEGEDEHQARALSRIDAALAKYGMPRSERRVLLSQISGTPRAAGEPVGTPRAADNNTPCAVENIAELFNQFSERLKK